MDIILIEIFPQEKAQLFLNNYLLLFLVIILFLRFFFEKLPAVNLAPYIHLPLSRRTLSYSYLLFSFFNLYNYLPVTFILAYWLKNNFLLATYNDFVWVSGFIILNYAFCILAIFFRLHFSKQPFLFVLLFIFFIIQLTFNSFNFADLAYSSSVWLFNGLLYESLYFLLIPITILFFSFYITFLSMKRSLYLG